MYDIGDPYPLTILTRDEDGNPADVDSVTVVFTLPDQTTTTPFALARRELGVYEYDYVTTVAGLHSWRVTVVGGNILGAQFDVFNVEGPATAFPLVGLTEAKDHLNIPDDDHSDDEELRRMVASASALVEAETRLWHRTTVVERVPAARVLYLAQEPVVSITSVVQDSTTFTGYTLTPAGGITSSTAGSTPRWMLTTSASPIVVTYEAGQTYVPVQVRDAVLLTVADMWRSQRGPVRSPLRGTVDEARGEMSGAYALPFEAQKMLEPWAKVGGIA